MNDDRSLERAARSWIEDGPTRAPERAIERALARIQTTPQERDLRILRRFPTMPVTTRVAAAAVIGVLLVGGAFFALGRPSTPAVGGPSSSPSPPAATVPPTAPPGSPLPSMSSATLPPFSERYASELNQLTLGYPAGWTLTRATVAAAGYGSSGLESYDVVATTNVRFIALSWRLSGESPAEWLEKFEPERAADPCHNPPGDRPQVVIGATVGLLTDERCSSLGPFPGNRWSRAIAAHGGRAYVFQLDAATADQLDWFATFLAAVALGTRSPSDSPAP